MLPIDNDVYDLVDGPGGESVVVPQLLSSVEWDNPQSNVRPKVVRYAGCHLITGEYPYLVLKLYQSLSEGGGGMLRTRTPRKLAS